MPSKKIPRKKIKLKKKILSPPPPYCIDKWLGYGDRKITMYHNKYEPIIWYFYDKKKFWLKDKGDDGFLMIECYEGDLTQHDYDEFKKERGWE